MERERIEAPFSVAGVDPPPSTTAGGAVQQAEGLLVIHGQGCLRTIELTRARPFCRWCSCRRSLRTSVLLVVAGNPGLCVLPLFFTAIPARAACPLAVRQQWLRRWRRRRCDGCCDSGDWRLSVRNPLNVEPAALPGNQLHAKSLIRSRAGSRTADERDCLGRAKLRMAPH